MHGPSGQGEGGRTGELCFNHSLIHTNLSWNKSLSLTKRKMQLMQLIQLTQVIQLTVVPTGGNGA